MKILKILLLFSMIFALVQSPEALLNAQGGEQEVVGYVSGSTDGYTLFKTRNTREVYLINGDGQIVHQWDIQEPAREAHLLENGNIIVSYDPVNFRGPDATFGEPYAQFAEYTWDGELVWSYEFDLGDQYQVHHGIEVLPNGNIMFLAWEYRTREEAIAMGRDPDDLGNSLWPDVVFEYDPRNEEYVWEWNAWDHTIQDFDPDLPNYGVVSENPQKIDINFYEPGLRVEDWMHSNAIDYNPELDQVVISVREFNEIWVVDHSISTEEAKGPAGDLLYRWGNPRAYDRGTVEDRELSFQHDAQWVPAGYPGEGNIIVFSNRHHSASELPAQAEEGLEGGSNYSKIVEITPPLQDDGTYLIEDGEPFGPEELTWSYGENVGDYFFYSRAQSGLQRLPNGNTLIIKSFDSVILEVTPEGEVAWEYVPPFFGIYSVIDGAIAIPSLFRARQYAPDYAGFSGRDLTGGPTIESLASTTSDNPARVTKNHSHFASLSKDIPTHFYVYVAEETETLTFTITSETEEIAFEIVTDGEDSLTELTNAETETVQYIAEEGPNFFAISADGPVDYEMVLTNIE